jgi:protein-S-isoprenylcysteine O-methyltransferase Ste14
MNALELKVPPPAVGLVLAAAMWGLAQIAASSMAVPNPHFAAAVVALVGIGFDIAGVVSFRRAKTTVNPLRPDRTSSLVSSGVYRFTRNPMYVGMLFLLIAWAIFLSSPWTLLGPLAFVLYINRFQIGPEEKVLGDRFGEEFSTYTKEVRRWL